MDHNTTSSSTINNHIWEDSDDLLLVNEDVNLNMSALRMDERYTGFDNNFGDTWIYPSNFPERAYQYNIVQKALFHNTLVVLPTGLGKTFIAAVVMYNIYRWYPMGKVVFMAPTRPLVAQQISACCKIMGIPTADSVEITGKLSKTKRTQLWQTKRVFFATPQSVQSDILDAELDFPFHAIKLVVVDEAHRAKGRYAYTDVISAIWRKNKYFRILALSATPGRRKDDVEEIIRNLFISTLEVRTEVSVDVVSYVHKRLLKTVVVELGVKLKSIRDELLSIADPHLRNLIDNHLISNRSGSISRNWLVIEQKRFRESLANNRAPQQRELSTDFSICISIYHAIELLERHGTRVFLKNFDETEEGGTKFVVKLRPDLRRLIEKIREESGPNPFVHSEQSMVNGGIAPIPRNLDFGHPKFEIARDHVLEHFQKSKDARCIIFCEYRESVVLMHYVLLQHRPLIRPKVFVGQGGTGSIRAVTQREQIKIMSEFRTGEYNALIATSVAEEGIDVGEVDLIVCFDINTSNPIRFIQRIGRTGRKKEGKVLLLATEGKEYAVLKEVLSERNKLNKSISRAGEFSSVFYKQSPRMVPTEFNPKCLKTFIQTNDVFKPKDTTEVLGKKKTQKTKSIQPRDLRHFFKPKVVLNADEIDVFEHESTSSNSNRTSRTMDLNALNEQQSIIDLSPNKTLKIDSKAMKKMNRYINTSTRGKSIDVQKILTSNKLSKSSLEFLVDFSPDMMCNIWSHMISVWENGINEISLPTKGLSPEKRKAVKSYGKLIEVLGSKDKITELMNHQKENLKNCSKLFKKYERLFEDLCHKDFCRDNFVFLTDKLEKLSSLIVPYTKEESFAQSMVYDAESEYDSLHESMQQENNKCEYSMDYISDSKYMSQWDDASYIADSFQHTPDKQMKSCRRRSVAAENAESYSSDEGVMFVGEIQQSTPLKTSFNKKCLLNLKNNQDVKPESNGFVENNKSFAEVNNKCSLPIDRNLENENYFDDQFDDIIAANSLILAHIESSNSCRNIITKNEITAFPSQEDMDNKFLDCASPSNNKISTLPNEAAFLSPPPNCIPDRNNTKSILDESNTTPYKCNNLKSVRALSNLSTKQFDNETFGLKSKPTSNVNLNEIHPELADIDFNNFSDEAFSDEIGNNFKIHACVEAQRNSPDIFEDISLISKSDIKDCKTPSKLTKCPSAEVSPCLLTKKALTWKEVRIKYGNSDVGIKPNESVKAPNESVTKVPVRKRLKRRIIDSDSDTSEESFSPKPTTNEDPHTLKKEIRNNYKKPRLHHQALKAFIDDEAVHSGSGSEDDIEHTQGCYMIDSVIVNDDDVENDDVNMTGVYLQSVRSPCTSSMGKFKIPPRRQYNDSSKIFSQKVPEDSYEQDSFIISDEDIEVDRSLCPLERAEEILKNRRKARRNAN